MFDGIDHVGAPTWDADRAASFFEAAGVPVAFEETLADRGIRAVFLEFDGVYLEFLEPIDEGPVKTFLERHGPGYHHVAYRVSDVDDAVAALRDDGVAFTTDGPVDGVGNSRVVFVAERHTGGFPVELVERTDEP